MDNPASAPPLSRVLSLGQDEVDTIHTRAPADIEDGMLRLGTFILAHLNSAPGREGTYRHALVALGTVVKDTMIRASVHAHNHHFKGVVLDPLPPPRVIRFDQPRSEKPGPAAPTLLGALPIHGRGLVEQPRLGWRAYAHDQLLARLNRVRFMAGPDKPADAPAPAAAPASTIEQKPLSPASRPPVIPKRQPEPGRETRPASLREAAGWFLLKDPRTLQRAIAKGGVAARKLSDKRWVFDVDEVDPDADAEPK